jgi:hypothetical protein
MHKNSGRKMAYVYQQLPPLPVRPRAAAVAAREIVKGAFNARYESADEGEKHVESADDVEPDELVIAGDKFLTKDDEPVSTTAHRFRMSMLKSISFVGWSAGCLPSMPGGKQVA